MNEMNIDSIDLCKIDIEGNEMNALIGAGDLIENIKLIQFEFGQRQSMVELFLKISIIFFRKEI